jgi:hypothetical protein
MALINDLWVTGLNIGRTFQYKYMKVGHEIYGLFKKNNLHEA